MRKTPQERYSAEDIQRAVETVLAGEMTFQQASEAFKIPVGTIAARKKILGNLILKQVNSVCKRKSIVHFVIQDICSNVCTYRV